MDLKNIDRLVTKKNKIDPLWCTVSISLIVAILIGFFFSTREKNIVESHYFEKIPEERVAKLGKKEESTDKEYELKEEIKKEKKSIRARQKGGGDPRLRVSQKGVLGIAKKQKKAKRIEIEKRKREIESDNRRSNDIIGNRRYKQEITYSPNNYKNTNNQINEEENPFIYTAAEPTSTFSIDVDNASYNNILHHVSLNILPPPSSIRIEEMINNFSYSYPVPSGSHPLSVTTEVSSCLWNRANRILRIGIKGRRLPPEGPPPSNFVFLIDVSGSMASAGKLTLFKQGLRSFIYSLHNQDRISIITYAGEAGLHLNSTQGNKTDVIADAIDRLKAGGSTAGSEGIQLAYRLANRNFIPNGNNRIILVTDGNFNVGESNQSDLVNLIQKKRGNGIFLTVIGMNVDNDEDEKTMEQLANNGDGNFNSVFTADELMRVFDEMNATFFTVAKDVKIQVKFEPDQVEAYRLIGYENRMLKNSDFTDDTRDAGEIGAEQTVTALYETVPSNRRKHSNISCNVNIRYKNGDENTSKLMTSEVFDHNKQIEMSTSDYRFATAVAGLGLLLSNSSYRGNLTYDAVIDLARSAANGPYSSQRYGFVDLANKCKSIAQREAVSLR